MTPIHLVIFHSPITPKEIDSLKEFGFYDECKILGLNSALFKTLNPPKWTLNKLKDKKHSVTVFEFNDPCRWESDIATEEVKNWFNESMGGTYSGYGSVEG